MADARSESPDPVPLAQRLEYLKVYSMKFSLEPAAEQPLEVKELPYEMFEGVMQEPPKVALRKEGPVYRATELHLAVTRHDVSAVSALCQNEKNLVNAQNEDADTALHLAAYWGQTEIAKVLIAAGACLDLQNLCGQTPLHVALKNPRGYEVAEVLLSSGGANNKQDTHWKTVLNYAAETECESLVLKVLAGIAKTKQVDLKSRMFRHLPRSVNAKVRISYDDVRLSFGYSEIEANFLDVQDSEAGLSALHSAACAGKTNLVKILLEAGSSSRLQSVFGWTPLHCASNQGFGETVDLICDTDGGNSLRDWEGKTALHYAVRFERILRKLLFSDVDPHVADNKGITPLKDALSWDNDDVVKIIISWLVFRGIGLEEADFGIMSYYFNETFEAFILECGAELQRMKDTNLQGRSYSYYDVATSHVRKLAVYLSCKAVRSELLRGNVPGHFPIYAKLIEYKVSRAESLRMLKKQCLKGFVMLESLPLLPRTSTNNILRLISEREMQNFVKAFHREIPVALLTGSLHSPLDTSPRESKCTTRRRSLRIKIHRIR